MKRMTMTMLAAICLSAGPAYAADNYDPKIEPDKFTDEIDNPFLTLPVGATWTYEGNSDGVDEKIVIQIPGWTKEILGVDTLVYWDRVYVDGELVEDTRDYLAQDDDGNVWYFGEDVDNYENGKFSDHDGAWIDGVDGAKPGLWMKADPQVGEVYRQEYYKGEAEDQAEVISLTETVETAMGTYSNCLKTFDFTELDPESTEHKFYCKEMGGLVLEQHTVKSDRAELTKANLTGGEADLPADYEKDGVSELEGESGADGKDDSEDSDDGEDDGKDDEDDEDDEGENDEDDENELLMPIGGVGSGVGLGVAATLIIRRRKQKVS